MLQYTFDFPRPNIKENKRPGYARLIIAAHSYVYLYKRDNFAREIPFHTLPCSTSAYQSVNIPCIKISGLK